MKSNYEDLHRLFRDSITAREIAEPLAAFDANQPAEKVKGFMRERGFDIVGVSSNGAMQGYVHIEDLYEGILSDYTNEFSGGDLLEERTPLLEVLEQLAKRSFVFLRFLGTPSAIVTRSDLQKAPVRMWLFGLVSLLEMQLLQIIKKEGDVEWWRSLLTEKRVAAAEVIYKERMKKNEDIALADCLQMGDKATIISKTECLYAKTGFKSKKDWKATMGKAAQLRNNLAHANKIDTNSWPEKAALVIRIETLIRRLEE